MFTQLMGSRTMMMIRWLTIGYNVCPLEMFACCLRPSITAAPSADTPPDTLRNCLPVRFEKVPISSYLSSIPIQIPLFTVWAPVEKKQPPNSVLGWDSLISKEKVSALWKALRQSCPASIFLIHKNIKLTVSGRCLPLSLRILFELTSLIR